MEKEDKLRRDKGAREWQTYGKRIESVTAQERRKKKGDKERCEKRGHVNQSGREKELLARIGET